MKKALLIALLCTFPAAAYSHPGKTDKYDGHKCLKDCEEWNLYYAEYHLHDKDRKPIRITKNRKRPIAVDSRQVLTAPTVTDQVVSSAPITTQTVTVYHQVTTIYEEKVLLSNPLIYVLLILLLLLLILKMNRKREKL